MRLLVVCPTRGRIARCAEMLTSFMETCSAGTEILFYVDRFDHDARQYADLFHCRVGVQFWFGPRLSIVDVYNRAFAAINADYYCDCNDDFVFHTKGWDEKLIAAVEAHGGLGMAYGQTQNLPYASVFSARSLEALGWWQPPQFTHQYVDNVWRDLFGALNQIYHVPDVWTEHKHPAYGTAPMDDTYRSGGINWDITDRDGRLYEEWRKNQMPADLERLRKAI